MHNRSKCAFHIGAGFGFWICMHACTLCVLFNVFDSGHCYWFNISLPHVPSEVRYDFLKILLLAIVIRILLGVYRVYSFFTHVTL